MIELPCPFCGKKLVYNKAKVRYDQLHGGPFQDKILGCFSSKCKMIGMRLKPKEG